MQVGLVNVSRGEFRGLQVGLVNYAEEADDSIGLIALTKKGGVWFDLWTSEVALIHAALRFRARRSYSFVSAGIDPLQARAAPSWSVGYGLGGPLLWRRHFSVELDNSVSLLAPNYSLAAPQGLDTLRLSLAWRPRRHLALWGALTLNLLAGGVGEETDFRPGYSWGTQLGSPTQLGVSLKLWPGFAAGLEF